MGAGPQSEALFARALRVLPGGVNSPFRTPVGRHGASAAGAVAADFLLPPQILLKADIHYHRCQYVGPVRACAAPGTAAAARII